MFLILAYPAILLKKAQFSHAIVIISNQALKPGPLKQWKTKVSNIAAAVCLRSGYPNNT
jgi:hypothetical protein